MAALILWGAALGPPLALAEEPPLTKARLAVWEVLPSPGANVSEAEGEWVELVALDGGDLGGLALSDSDGEIDFIFPAREARRGEFIVVANGATPPLELVPGAMVFLAGKAWWTFDDRGDDVTLLSPDGQVLDRFAYGEGPGVEQDAPSVSSIPAPAPPAGIAVGIGPSGPGLLVPTPGGPNRPIARAETANVSLSGVVVADALVGLVLCSAAPASSNLFGWTVTVNGTRGVVADVEMARFGCLYVGADLAARSLAKIATLMGGLPLASATMHLPRERWAVPAAVHDVWGREAVSSRLPAGNGAGSRVLTLVTPCSCQEGWQQESVGPASATGAMRSVFDVQVVSAGPPLAAALFALLDNTTARLDVNAYLITSAPFVQALRQAAARGVFVRLLLEPSPAGVAANDTALSPSSIRSFADAGVWVRAFSTGPPNPARDHAKFLVADGRFVLISTENFVGAALEGPRANTGYAVQIDSEALSADLLAVFDWDFAQGEDLCPPRGGDPPFIGPPANRTGVASVGALLASPVAPDPVGAWVRAIEDAHESLQLETLAADRATLGPSSPLGHAILRAAARGVRIEIMTAASTLLEADSTGSEVAMRELVAALPVGSPLDVRVDPRQVDDPSHLHAKVMVVDGRAAILGSHNLVAAAFRSNREISIYFEDSGAVAALSRFLRQDFSRALPLLLSPVALGPGNALGGSLSPEPDAFDGPSVLGLSLCAGGAAMVMASFLAPLRRGPWRLRAFRRGRSTKSRGRRLDPDGGPTLLINMEGPASAAPGQPDEAVANSARGEESPPPPAQRSVDERERPQTAFDLFLRT